MKIINYLIAVVFFSLATACASAPEKGGDEVASIRSSTASTVAGKKIDRHALAQLAGLQALHICTGLFTSEMPEEVVYKTMRKREGISFRRDVDSKAKVVRVNYLDDMPPRIAVWRQHLGCTQLPIGASLAAAKNLTHLPTGIRPPALDGADWPMGDVNAVKRLSETKTSALNSLLDAAFADESEYGGDTWGIAIIKDGKIISERYSEGYGPHVSARTNSMCKSLSATIVGTGVQKNLIDLDAKAPLHAWRGVGDPRGDITVNNLLQMGSGLYTQGAGNPQGDLYGSGAPASEVSALNMIDAQPGDRFVYAGSDTILAVMALKQATGKQDSFIAYPYTELLWKIGMTRTVMETDWKNDFLGSGQCWSTVRDFGRFALLYLNDGEWEGMQIFPKDWSSYVSTLAPAQPASFDEGGAGYGAQFWLYGPEQGLPSKGYSAAGAFGQFAMIVPDENLAVIRRGLDYEDQFEIAKFTADIISALEE